MSNSREMKPRWLAGHAVMDFRHRFIRGACQHCAALHFLAVSRIAPARPQARHDHFAGAAGKQTWFLDRIEDYWKDTVVRDMTRGDIRQVALALYSKASAATRNRQAKAILTAARNAVP